MIEELISECSDYDFKVTLELKKPKSWLKSICAFANGLGGTLIFGISKDKRVVGVDRPQEVSDKITELINSRIKPVPNYTLTPIEENGKTILQVKVLSGLSTPFYYESDGTKDAYIRSGNSTIVAPIHILNELILKGINQTFDTIVTRYKKEDFSFSYFEATFLDETKSRITSEDYMSFGLMNNEGFLTNAGVLLADQVIYRQSRVFCTRWNGLDKTSLEEEAVDDKELTGCILKLLHQAVDFVTIHNQKRWRKVAHNRVERPSYDVLAIREAIVNALIHRQYTRVGTEISIDIYDNRIEISSPGEMVSGDELPREITTTIKSERRNPVIADLFSRMGYMERRGSGLKKITEKTNLLFHDTKNHVEFKCSDGYFIVVIYDSNYSSSLKDRDISDTNAQINKDYGEQLKKAIIENERLSKTEMAIILGKSVSFVRKVLKAINAEYLGTPKDGHWEIYQESDFSKKEKKR